MKRVHGIVLLCLLYSSALAGEKGRAGSTDAFPLRSGLQLLFAYQWQSLYIDMGYGQRTTDSGTVAYFVVDSTAVSDTSRSWTINETRHLLHRHYSVNLIGTPTPDSSYWVDATVQISLLEYLTGLHRLQGSSLVWSFPVRDTLQDIGYGRRDTAIHVFRYGAAGSPIAVSLWNGNSWIADTLAFESGQGLAFHELDKNDASIVKNNYRLVASRLDIPTPVTPHRESSPGQFGLAQNYPNPFNPSTTITFSSRLPEHINVSIYSITGQKIETILDGAVAPGEHSLVWQPSGVASGVYLCRMEAGKFVSTIKLVYTR